MSNSTTNIAIIGSGIAGLGAAYNLKDHANITLYERNDYVGGHARTRHINYDGKNLAVDTGFIVFNHRNYPLLSKLFTQLRVPTHKTSMSFGVKCEDRSLEWGAENINALFGQRRNLLRVTFYKFLFDILKFNRHALDLVHQNANMTLSELLDILSVGDWFRQYYILPMGGAIWSCALDDILNFPASFFVHFFDSHGLLSVSQQPEWYTVTGGSETYINLLTSSFKDRIRTSCSVTRVTRENGKVQISDSQGNVVSYDHVVFACHAPEALAVLADTHNNESSLLSVFRRQKNKAFLHKNSSLMPERRACWSSWIYHAPSQPTHGPIMTTYWMNHLQGIDKNYPLFITLNPHQPIPQADVFDEHVFYHPIYDPTTVRAQSRVADMQGQRNTWFCGAYNRNGFHEDGYASAVDIATKIKRALL